MSRKKITSYFLYRRRSLLTYIFIGLALVVFVAVGALIPGGITQAEQDSAVRAINSGLVEVNAPYYALQRLSISTLGLSAFSIKLPSILLGLLLGTILFLLLRRWTSLAAATFSSLIIFASTTFLSLVSTGTPAVLYVLFPALLLFFGTRVLAHDRGLIPAVALLLVTIALALLTPSMVYLIVLALALAALNPHVRYGIKRLPATGVAAMALGFVITVAPAIYLVITAPSALPRLLALPPTYDIAASLTNLGELLGNFLNPGITMGWPSPLIGLATVGLSVIGLYFVIKAVYTARAQFIIGWSAIALALAVINPDVAILLYLPIVLLAALGLSELTGIWYRTFPFNPYARITALVPISILIVGIVAGSSLRYVNTVHYADGSAELYSRDLQLIRQYVKDQQYYALPTLAVDERDKSFYSLTTDSGFLFKKSASAVVPVPEAASTKGLVISSKQIGGRKLIRILTDGRTNSGDRFYVYQ